jgi:hypothetical protein
MGLGLHTFAWLDAHPACLLNHGFYSAESVRQAVENVGIPHAANPDGKGLVTVSIGVTTALSSLGGTIKMPEGLPATDTALYKAKHEGRNRVEGSILPPRWRTPSRWWRTGNQVHLVPFNYTVPEARSVIGIFNATLFGSLLPRTAHNPGVEAGRVSSAA